MKMSFRIIVFFVVLLGSQLSRADIEFRGAVTGHAYPGSQNERYTVSALSIGECDLLVADKVEEFIASGLYRRVTSTACFPVIVTPFVRLQWDPKWLDDCPLCPLFSDRFTEQYYPDVLYKVRDLVTQFKILDYTQQLQKLQKDYNLDEFGKQMHQLEIEQRDIFLKQQNLTK